MRGDPLYSHPPLSRTLVTPMLSISTYRPLGPYMLACLTCDYFYVLLLYCGLSLVAYAAINTRIFDNFIRHCLAD